MRIVTIFFILFTLTSLFAQNNPLFTKEHRQIEAERKARALEKSFSQTGSFVAEPGRGYDVTYYGLSLDIYPSQAEMNGVLTLTASSTDDNLNDIWLDFQSHMTIDSITAPSADGFLNFSHANGRLVVTLEKAYALDENFEITIFYHGRTDFGGQSVFGTSFGHAEVFGRDHIWSLSEPYGARDWWPCKDTPLDKADSMDIWYTVPQGMSAAANGNLISEITSDGRTTFHWKENYPIATYLVSIAAYDYRRYEDEYISQSGDTLPIMFFVAPENYNGSQQNFALVDPMIVAFADMFGEYPFMGEKYGHAEALMFGAMEHQTITSIGPIHISGGEYSEGLIAHELAHQWWGDMVTCASFHDIWLNEGFASYSEALVAEYAQFADYKSIMAGMEYYGGGTIYVDDTTNAGRIFDQNLSYSKGAYVLHMLRGVVGDETFFEIMKAWYNNAKTKYKAAYTEDFQQVCEEVSGMDLEKYFQQWIYGEYYPVYSYGFKAKEVEGGFDVTVYIDQIQDNTNLFWMPIDVQIITANDTLDFVAWDSLASQQFSFFVEEEPLNVVIDPDDWILKETRNKLIDPTFDRGTLLVNGMSWTRRGVPESYENRAFWGTAPVSFWDITGEPNDGYPETLPEAEGQGELITKKLGQYSTIIWLSSNTGSDRENWNHLPIIDYLQAGGNIIFIAQNGSAFLNNELTDYLGITWDEQDNLLIKDFESTYAGLWDIALSDNMVFISGFDTILTKESSTLLYKAIEGFNEAKGVGVWSNPQERGDFVYLAARPWMMDHQHLKLNMLYMLENFMNEAVVSLEDENNSTIPGKFEISNVYPNPFNAATRIDFSLPDQREVTVKIYDVVGKQVAELVKGKVYKAGKHSIQWNANKLASGLYFIQLVANKELFTKKAILMK